jgi:hypothetical protein
MKNFKKAPSLGKGKTRDKVGKMEDYLEHCKMQDCLDKCNLICKIRNAHFQSAKNLILAKGLDINDKTVDYLWRTPLHFACSIDNVDFVKFLVRHGANVHIKDINGNKPIRRAKGEVYTYIHSVMYRKYWKMLFAISCFLGIHKRAVISANHPLRKELRGEFESD